MRVNYPICCFFFLFSVLFIYITCIVCIVHTDNLNLKKFLICFAEALTDITYAINMTPPLPFLAFNLKREKKKNNSGGEILRPEGFSNM